MKYLLLIYENEGSFANVTEEEGNKIFAEYMDYTKGIRKATATTVRQRNGKTLTTDGPFAETKEQLGGYYLVEAKDLDEAIKLAGGIPAVRNGSIEVRPIMPTPPID